MTDKPAVRRGLLEAVVILSSILLAFWIDAAWDRRQEVGMEDAMLASVAEELERNQASLGQTVARLTTDLDRIDRFLRASDQVLMELPQDSVSRWVGALNGRASFNGDLAAISMLLRTPALDTGESLSVRGLLATWRNAIDEAELLGEQLDQAQIRVREFLARYAARSGAGGFASVPAMAARLGPAGLLEMRGDEDLIAAVLSKADAQRLHLLFLEGASQSAVQLSREVAALRAR